MTTLLMKYKTALSVFLLFMNLMEAQARLPNPFVSCTPPANLREYFQQFPQELLIFVDGHFIQMPYYFWGSGNLGLTGTVSKEKAAQWLKPYDKEPLVVPTPNGEVALAAVFAPSYEGSCAKAYNSIFFGLFVKDNAFCDSIGNCAPGFMFVNFYSDTSLSFEAGSIWDLPRERASPISAEFTQSRRIVHALAREGTISLKWSPEGDPDQSTGIQTFRNFVPSKKTGPSQLIMTGTEFTAYFNPRKDIFYVGPRTAMGKSIQKLGGFTPYQWKFYQQFYGVQFYPK